MILKTRTDSSHTRFLLDSSEKKMNAQYGHDITGEISGQSSRNRMAGFLDPHCRKVYSDSIKRGFRGAHNHRRHPSNKTVWSKTVKDLGQHGRGSAS